MYDIVIIGSGPAGLSAAIYAQRESLKAVVVEKEFMGTGQIAESERVDNYPGLYGETGFDLGEKFRTHAEKLGAEFVEGEVTEVERVNGNFSVNIDGGESLETKTVIYAAGTQRRKLGVKGEKEFSGNGVSYCAVCDAAFYKDKITVVTGGGDTALGDALLLSRFCKKVYLVHRRDSFRAGRALQNRVFATENIEALTNATVSEINGDTKVTSVTLLQNGEEKQLDCNGVFVAVGSVPDTKPLANLVKTDKYGYIIADESGKTSADGIFAGGDIRTKVLRQVVTAVSDGANCVISAEKYLDEKQ